MVNGAFTGQILLMFIYWMLSIFFFSMPIDCYLWLMVGGYAAQNCDLGWHTPKRVLMEVALTPAPRFRIIAISLRDIYFV